MEDTSRARSSALLALVAFLVYTNSLWNGFVWDDAVVILSNIPRIASPFNLFSSIDAGRSLDVAPYYRPLSLLSFYGDFRLHGLTPFLVRLTSVLLHVGNTILLYRLVVNITGRRYAAYFTALLFSLHPIHAEAVDFNSARSTLLVTMFCLLSLLLHQKAVAQNRFTPALGGAAAALAGQLSKEIALGVIPLVAALEFSRCRIEPQSRGNALIRLVPYAAVSLTYWALRSKALAQAGIQLEIDPGLMTRLMYNAYIIPKYLLSLVWPFNLSPFYLIPEDLRPITLQLLFSWVILAAAFWLLIRYGTRKTVCFGLAWLVIFWLPVSGIVDIPSSPVADRYFYMPAIGLWILAGEHIARFYDTDTGKQRVRLIVVMVLFVGLAALTFRQNRFWYNGVTLFTRVLQLAPDSVYAYHNLGCAYLEDQKNLSLAEKAFMQALMLDPTFPRLQDKLGYIRMQRGDYYGALQYYGEAARQNPLDAEAHLNRALLLEKLSRFEEALHSYQLFYASPGDELAEARSRFRGKIDELSRMLAKRNAGNGSK